MTVSELIEELQQYDDDTEVVIACFQARGTDFGYNVGRVEPVTLSPFDGDDKVQVVAIVEGYQEGSIREEEE